MNTDMCTERARRRRAKICLLFLTVLVTACATNTVDVGVTQPPPDPGAFTPAASAPEGGAGAAQCAVTFDDPCTPGFATCDVTTNGSQYACGTHVAVDVQNCGDCGVACPKETTDPAYSAGSVCVAGRCVPFCDSAATGRDDCNGLVEDGCEATLATDRENCGACGKACAAGVACVGGVCGAKPGCPAGQVECGGYCADLQKDNENCGVCGRVCEFETPTKPLPPNTKLTCRTGKCEGVVCAMPFADCDVSLPNDLARANPSTGNGCEVNLGAPDVKNCGACGKACASGTCLFDERLGAICDCPAGQVQCWSPEERVDDFGQPLPDDHVNSRCRDLASSKDSCGTCGAGCPAIYNAYSPDADQMVCVAGVCNLQCGPGFANCDGIVVNGCETEIGKDPTNCGGCGVQCNREVGQPCVDGVCAMKDCGPGVPAR